MNGQARPRILLVEDDYFLAQELARDLTSAGAEIVGFAPTLERATAIADGDAEIDGAVLDINLRDRTVFPAIEGLRLRGVPVVFVTGYDDAIVPERYRDIPRLTKPADPACIMVALNEQRSRTPVRTQMRKVEDR
ncbi:response regulator [Arsenicitalea aurantiaca]|uniref:Response regulator n=1 Tax=Arsenicitalea aurantiaca TaxID=1783274 RepID=A0A433X8I2_9HYPH|nr:response regulator [Arsenicitalea aurantiaca]RUT30376.1 response regulator [Arsenicitalea aurantiaca]